MKTKFDKMRANRERVLKAPASFPALTETPTVPYMEIDGVKYVEAPEINTGGDRCEGCAFDHEPCCRMYMEAKRAFGADCDARDVIYIEAAS